MYREEQLVRIAKRENNTKRSYLVVNRLQGKHVSVRPEEAFSMFEELAEGIRAAWGKERLLLVGFAETATAIGAAAAVKLGTLFTQTTREKLRGAEYLYFSEAHSHATEQKLVKDGVDRVIGKVDRIVFVEDEVTTGNTILQIVDILEREYPGKVSFGVASLLNGMDEEALERYRERRIPLCFLVKTDHGKYGEIAAGYRGDGTCLEADGRNPLQSWGEAAEQPSGAARACGEKLVFRQIEVGGLVNARGCTAGDVYHKACEELWISIRKTGCLVDKRRILVLGTEEFMYPALYVAGRIEEACREAGQETAEKPMEQRKGVSVRFHATTRSPILTSTEEEYPLHVRYELRSLYEGSRRTFVYDLESCDLALVITDAEEVCPEGVYTLVNALARSGNRNILLVKWKDETGRWGR